MNRNPGRPQLDMLVPLTPMVKNLLIINISLWVLGIIFFKYYLKLDEELFYLLGLIPRDIWIEGHVWQFVSYMFIHSYNLTHILFNMLLLWWLGSELELLWGSRKFLIYYLSCGIGAGLLYFLVAFGFSQFATSESLVTTFYRPVVGASGAVFGLMMAYGILFGERVVYFFMIFPMKAKYFVMIIGVIEVLMMLNNGFSGAVANLAHLGGLIVGLLLLWGQAKWQKQKRKTYSGSRVGQGGRPHLKVIAGRKKEPPTFH